MTGKDIGWGLGQGEGGLVGTKSDGMKGVLGEGGK